MADRAYNLAIETSGPSGSVSLGRGAQLLESADLPPQRRHTVDLMPTIDRLCTSRGVAPTDLGEIYVSIGPGSFTGLRIGVTTAKLLAQVLGVKVVAVPTIQAVAMNAPPPAAEHAGQHLAVCLNVKNETGYTGLFAWDGANWAPAAEPALATLGELIDSAPRPLVIVGDPLPGLPDPLPEGVDVLAPDFAPARSTAVWRLGHAMAGRGDFIDPLALLPLYARRPEAEELWEKRQQATGAT